MSLYEDDEKENKEVEDIEIVIGDDSDLEFSTVNHFINGMKPIKEKKKNVVIPGKKKKEDKDN